MDVSRIATTATPNVLRLRGRRRVLLSARGGFWQFSSCLLVLLGRLHLSWADPMRTGRGYELVVVKIDLPISHFLLVLSLKFWASDLSETQSWRTEHFDNHAPDTDRPLTLLA